MKQRWQPKILVIQDEISLVPAAVENMMLYRSMRARQDEGLDPASYFHPGELMGHIPILLIAGDFLQIKPANEISLADNLEELIRKMPHRVQTEHHAAQAALMTIDTVIHLKKSKRFLDAHLPEITTAMRTCTPAAPLSEDHLAQLRARKIENCKKELTTLECIGRTLLAAWWNGQIEMRKTWMCRYFVCKLLTKGIPEKIKP